MDDQIVARRRGTRRGLTPVGGLQPWRALALPFALQVSVVPFLQTVADHSPEES